MVVFNKSLPVDKVLYEADIRGSITIARALQQLNLLTEENLRLTYGGRAALFAWNGDRAS